MVNVHAKEAEADAGVGGKNDRSGQADSSQSDGSEQADVTSSEWKGIVATVDERIEWCQFQTLVTKNFSSWEDVHTTLCVLPEVIVRLQDMLADHPEAKGWVEKPGDFPAEASTPEVSPPESAAKSNSSKHQAAQGLSDDVLERHKDKRHAS